MKKKITLLSLIIALAIVAGAILLVSTLQAGETMPVDMSLYKSPKKITDILGTSFPGSTDISCGKCGSTRFHYLPLRKNGYWQNPSGKLNPESDGDSITHYGLICSTCSKKYLIQIREVYYENGKTKYTRLNKVAVYSK